MADTVRTVSVELKMQISDFEAGAVKAEVLLDGLSVKVKDFGTKSKTGFDGASKASTDFSRLVTANLKDGETAFQSLTAKSADLRGEVTKLRESFAATGDKSVFGDLKSAENDLKTVDGLLKDMGGNADKVTTTVKSASNEVSSLSGSLVQAGVAAAPFLVPLAAGSVLGVLAAGGVGAGILGQLKDPAVQVAAKSFTQSVSGALTSATTAFGPQIVKALDIAQTGVDNFIGDLKPAFDSLAPETQKIAKDLTDGLAQAGPSLAKSLIAAEPDLEALSRLVGSLPGDAASFFSGLSIGASGGARALDDLDNSLHQLSGELGTDLGAISATYGEITKLSDAAHGNAQNSIVLSGAWRGVANALEEQFNPIKFVSDGINDLRSNFGHASSAADTFDGSVKGLGVDTTNMAPVIVGVGKSVDYLGLAAITAGQPVSDVGKSVQSLGEHAGSSDPAVMAVGKSVQSMGEHAGTSNLATQALGFSVQSLGEHAGTSDPAVLAVGKSMQSMGEHAGTSNLATQELGFSVQSMGEHSGTATQATNSLGFSVKSMGEHSGSAIGQLNGADTAVQNMAPSAEATAGAFNDLAKSISASSNAALIAAGNELSIKQSYADFTKALKDNGKGFDENTQKGRDNESALLGALGAVQKNYQAQVDAGTATFDTTKKYDAQVDKLITLAQKNGLAAGKADDLRSSLEKVQGSYTATVTVKVRVAETQAQAQLLARTTGQRIANAQGGVYTHADVGLVSAHVQQATYPAQYAYAEPQTGGEAFIPKVGNYGRSMSILSAAAGWYGARVVPNGSTGGAAPVRITVSAAPNMPQGILNMLLFAVQQHGGDPVKALTPR